MLMMTVKKDSNKHVPCVSSTITRLNISKIHICETKRLTYRDAKPKLGNIELGKHHGNVRPS